MIKAHAQGRAIFVMSNERAKAIGILKKCGFTIVSE
jgi:hypothetical protein